MFKIWILFRDGKPFRVGLSKQMILDQKTAFEYENQVKKKGWWTLHATPKGEPYRKFHKSKLTHKWRIGYAMGR